MGNIRTETVKVYCEKYADTIFVRAKINGKWQPCSYATLTPDEQDKFVKKWSDSLGLPHRVVVCQPI